MGILDLTQIKVWGIDVDGTMTNGEYIVSDSGSVSKSFYSRDFDALSRLVREGFKVVFVTGANDGVLEQKLLSSGARGKYDAITGSKNKANDFCQWLTEHHMLWDNAAFIGDAENDLEIMDLCHFTCCPADAIEEIAENSHYCSTKNAGHGAVYDCIRKFFDLREIAWIKS